MREQRRGLTIDARARGPNGPLALESLQGGRVLDHHLALAARLGAPAIAIHVEAGATDRFTASLARPPAAGGRAAIATLQEGETPPDADAILRIDRVYDASRLRRCLRRGTDPEAAVIWRLDSPAALAAAGDELRKRRDYQPLGRHWALRPARAVAALLRPSAVRPDHLTLLAALLMAGAALLVAAPALVPMAGLLAAGLLALALILDTADGHLARLQGTSSRRGRWLDATLDELADMLLHAGCVWGAYRASGSPLWLAAGMAYAMGKYVFVVSNLIYDDAVRDQGEVQKQEATPPPGGPRRIAHWIGHADVRWHAWIVLAATGALRFELLLFVAYYWIRAAAGGSRKWRAAA